MSVYHPYGYGNQIVQIDGGGTHGCLAPGGGGCEQSWVYQSLVIEMINMRDIENIWHFKVIITYIKM